MKRKVCGVCKVDFTDQPTTRRKYCTRECAVKALVIKIDTNNSRRRVNGRVVGTCGICNKEFVKGSNVARYCENPECKRAGLNLAIEAQRKRRLEKKLTKEMPA